MNSCHDIERCHKAPKVCHIVATNEGATWMVEQLRELRDQHGCDVTAVVSDSTGSLIDKLDAEGITHVAFNFSFGSLPGLVRMPLTILNLAGFLRQQHFDVVQSHVFRSILIGRPAAWLADVPVRLSMISGPFHLEAQTSRWIDRGTHWMETMLIPSCQESRRLCLDMGVTEDRLALVYYGADEKKFDPSQTRPTSLVEQFGLGQDVQLIGMVSYFYRRLPRSRWVPRHLFDRGGKGHEDLIKAASLVQAQFPSAKFLMIGSGWGEFGEAYLQELKLLVKSLGLEETVLFTGYHEDVNGVLRELDVAVQASLSENLGGTIEALLMECPLVVTRVGGMPDAVLDGQTGILVNPSDPEDLARGIIQQLRDPERARSLAAAGRKLALERFTLSRTVSDLSELYATLLGREGSAQQKYRLWISSWRLVVLFLVSLLTGLWFLPQLFVLKIWDRIKGWRTQRERN